MIGLLLPILGAVMMWLIGSFVWRRRDLVHWHVDGEVGVAIQIAHLRGGITGCKSPVRTWATGFGLLGVSQKLLVYNIIRVINAVNQNII